VLLLLDNYDSFTYNLNDYITSCGAPVEVVRNDAIDIASIADHYQGIILSPGPGKPKAAGQMMQILQQYHTQLPIFGVCLGMQAIGEFFGAQLSTAKYPMHGKVSEITFESTHPMFDSIEKPLSVCRYHSLILNHCEKKPFEVLAKTAQNEPMAIAHHTLPIWGVQFHPEAILTTQGMQIIKNWLSCIHLISAD